MLRIADQEVSSCKTVSEFLQIATSEKTRVAIANLNRFTFFLIALIANRNTHRFREEVKQIVHGNDDLWSVCVPGWREVSLFLVRDVENIVRAEALFARLGHAPGMAEPPKPQPGKARTLFRIFHHVDEVKVWKPGTVVMVDKRCVGATNTGKFGQRSSSSQHHAPDAR